ncbi:MAG: glycoside hydrolase family 97 N-terminal domain-containing protein, partial [Bacteroidales bacterium]|nr:glycoside hydrolase family 97 N-terminal domain-containing protein [Bacteroidales bacterium]
MRKLFFLLAAALLAAACTGSESIIIAEDVLESPDGKLRMSFGFVGNGAPAYTLEYDGKAVVKPSRLGFDLTDGSNLKEGFEVISTAFDSKDEVWNTVWGEESHIRNH